MNKQQKIERWAQREVLRNIHTIIIDDDQGGYVAFGRYYLKPAAQLVEVYNLSNDLLGTFSSKRTAMSWCVAEKHGQLRLADSIRNLDIKKQNLSADIECRRQLADRSSNRDFTESVLTKLQSKVQSQAHVHRELEKCLNSAKYIQLRGFQNETARAISN